MAYLPTLKLVVLTSNLIFQVVLYHPDALQTQMYQYKDPMDVSTPTAEDMLVPDRFLLERETRS